MPKKKQSAFVCDACGHDESKWLGHCPSCGEWNTFKQVRLGPHSDSAGSRRVQNLREPVLQKLSEVVGIPPERHSSGIAELDRVLGGGLSPGTTILIGGEPGIGKSTLMLQTAALLKGKGVYVTGEEIPSQVKNRADRLNLEQNQLEILSEVDMDAVLGILDECEPQAVVVDSIQTMISQEAGLLPGTPNQLKTVAHKFTMWAKKNNAVLFLVAHVTKEGTIAGPKVIEHLVDTVLYFDHTVGDLRILRASKNRMGSVDEVGLFRMGAKGLSPIGDPTGVFLEHRKGRAPAGSSITAVYEGSRVLLVEIQALTVPAKGAGSRVYSDRVDAARVSRIAAVLERHAALRLSDQDIYVNVAGGLRIGDTGADLALALALCSARTEKPLPADMVFAGELSLAGEIRPVPHLRRRIKTAVDSGFGCWTASEASDENGPFPGNGKAFQAISEAIAHSIVREDKR